MPKHLIAILALIFATLACNWSEIAPLPAPVIEPSPLPTFAISTLTPVPSDTPQPTPTTTPNIPIAWPKDLGANCRYGPGKEWQAVSSLPAETVTEIAGRTVDTSWWYVNDPLNVGGFCWVSFDVVDTAGNINVIPIAKQPSASVHELTVSALVIFSGCGGPNTVTFSGSASVNGPISITYHWEVSGDVQVTSPEESIQLSQSGTQKLTSNFFSADCGNYTLKLVVTSPNQISAIKPFVIQAP